MKIAVAGLLTAGAVIAFPATAAADPPPSEIPVDPAAPPRLLPTGFHHCRTSPRRWRRVERLRRLSGGLPANPFTANPDNAYFLAQNPIPEASGAAVGTPPNLSAFNNAWLLPQNLVPSAPGEGQIYDAARRGERQHRTARPVQEDASHARGWVSEGRPARPDATGAAGSAAAGHRAPARDRGSARARAVPARSCAGRRTSTACRLIADVVHEALRHRSKRRR